MRIAVTGGTGFLGRHLVRRLREADHQVVVGTRREQTVPNWQEQDPGVSIATAPVTDRSAIEGLVRGTNAVAHLAGINYERGGQTYEDVHVRGTEIVLAAAEASGVDRFVLTSYLRARPGTENGYFATKWKAEQCTRASEIPATVLKPAAVFGPGDQLLSNLVHWIKTMPILPLPQTRSPLRPVAVGDVVDVLEAALVEETLTNHTVPLMGPEKLALNSLVERLGRYLGRRVLTVPAPYGLLYPGAWMQERVLAQPILTRAGLRMLHEGMSTAAPNDQIDSVPKAFRPQQAPTIAYMRRELPQLNRFGLNDVRWFPAQ